MNGETSSTASTCGEHPRRPSAGTCSVCGNKVCAECLVRTPVGFKCRGCAGHSGQKKAPGGRSRAARLGVGALVLVVVAGLAFALLRGGEPDEEVADPPGPAAGERPQSVVSFAGADGLRLRGTLRVPDGATGPSPGVVIVPGFGSTDRNGVASAGGLPDPLYRDLSDALAEVGVASLRYDKRGTGESPLGTDQVLAFDDMVDDAAAALAFLSERVEIDADALGFVGHDEGGLASLRVAGADPRVAAVVLVSTPGRPLVEVLADDLMATSDQPGEGEAHVAELRAAVDHLLATGELPEQAALRPALRPLFPPGRETYAREVFSLDPADDAAGLDVPVLIVRGDRDPGVSAEDTEQLVAALDGDAVELVGRQAGNTLALEGSPVVRDADVVGELAEWCAATLGVGAGAREAPSGTS